MDKGIYLGNLHPIHNIKPMGIHFCTSCPAIFRGAHLPECEVNKLKMAELDKLRKKRLYKAEARAKREAEPESWMESGWRCSISARWAGSSCVKHPLPEGHADALHEPSMCLL